MKTARVYTDSAEKYLELSSAYNQDGCLIFDKRINRDGYGQVSGTKWGSIYGVNMAHQLSYILTYGEYDRSLNVCHTCDIPNCINPAHLWVGTQADNMLDKKRKGRAAKPDMVGHRNIRSKLTDENILFIRNSNGVLNCRDICMLLNISSSTVYGIRSGTTWRHLL